MWKGSSCNICCAEGHRTASDLGKLRSAKGDSHGPAGRKRFRGIQFKPLPWRHQYAYLTDIRPAENLRHRGHPGPGPGRGGPAGGQRRIRSGGGHLRLRKIHPAAHAGRPGPAHRRHRHRGRNGHLLPEGRGADHFPAPENRVCISELQSGSRAERL